MRGCDFGVTIRGVSQVSPAFSLIVADRLAKFRRVGRFVGLRFVAILMVLSVLSAITDPFASQAANVCPMACCLAHQDQPDACPMHPAAPAPPKVAERDPDDPLCRAGAPAAPAASETITIVAEPDPANADRSTTAETPSRNGTSVSNIRVIAPCGPDCSAGVSGTNQVRKGRDSASSSSIRIGDQAGLVISRCGPSNPVIVRSPCSRQTSPRGPPTQFSL